MTTAPLVVWDNHLICDGCDHEIRVTTDGTRLVAVGTWGDTIRSTIERVDTELSFLCPDMIVKQDEECNWLLVADLATEHWCAALALRTLVAEHGTEVVR